MPAERSSIRRQGNAPTPDMPLSMQGCPLPLLPAASTADRVVVNEEPAWTLTTLPDDILSLVLAFLSPMGVAISSQTCKTLHCALTKSNIMNRSAVEAKVLRAANEQNQEKFCEARHVSMPWDSNLAADC